MEGDGKSSDYTDMTPESTENLGFQEPGLIHLGLRETVATSDPIHLGFQEPVAASDPINLGFQATSDPIHPGFQQAAATSDPIRPGFTEAAEKYDPIHLGFQEAVPTYDPVLPESTEKLGFQDAVATSDPIPSKSTENLGFQAAAAKTDPIHVGFQEAVPTYDPILPESTEKLGLQDAVATFDPIPSKSTENLGFPAAVASSDPIPTSSSKTRALLSEDLRDKIVRQVEYYFSDENLPNDKFLMKFVKKNKEGFVPIAVIASFRKMEKLVQDNSLVEAALRTSSQLVVSSDGKKVRRLHLLPDTDTEDAKSRTVLVENLPEDYSTESIQLICGGIGNIKKICIRDPHSKQQSTKTSKAQMLISGKLHAIVEYETVEEAEKAVATLNDEKNWRSGMRVELLLKRMVKYGLAPRVRKGAVSEKSHTIPSSNAAEDEQNAKSFDQNEVPEEEEEHLPSEKGGRRCRKGRGRGYKHHNVNGHGHGSVFSGLGSEGLSKPPPGPRMPDGTRGFTLGRGRPLLADHN